MLSYIYTIAILVSGIITTSLHAATVNPVQNGKIDLTHWNSDEQDLLNLKGDWEFYWSQLLTPEDFKTSIPNNRSLIPVPGSWNRVADFNEKGFATYRLRVQLAKIQELALTLPTIWSSSRVYLDGKLVAKAGRVGEVDDKKVYEPGTREHYFVFTPKQNDFDLIIQVSSFEFFLAGISAPVMFGTPAAVLRHREIEMAIANILVGSLFIMSFYHLCLFALRTKARSTLYFGLMLLSSGAYVLAGRGSGIILFIPDLSFNMAIRLFNGWIPGIAVFTLFTYELFPKYYSKRVAWSAAYVCFPLYALIC